MNIINNDKGIALVTSLMLTLITLSITLVMMYIVLQNTQISGAQKRYKNSLDAAVGGVEIVTMDALPYLLSYTTDIVNTLEQNLQTGMPNLVSLQVNESCLRSKLVNNYSSWDASCIAANKSTDATESPDISFVLKSQISGGFATVPGYKVYAKIVSTTVGSSDRSGRSLSNTNTNTPPPSDVGSPFIYRIEVTGQSATNPRERANLSVLYAY